MHDYFWSLAGREGWYEPEPQRYTSLAKFFIDFGRLRYGSDWDGNHGKPSEVTAKPLREELAQLAAAGKLKTCVLNPNTYEFQAIGAAHWRNEAALRAIFSRCQLDPMDPSKVSSDGSQHGQVFVTNDSGHAVLSAVGLSSTSSSSTVVTTDYLSTYIRFLIHLAQTEKTDFSRETAQKVKAKIEDEWKIWKQQFPTLAASGPLGDLSVRLTDGMAVLLRGEQARIERTAGARKNSVTKKRP